MQTHKPWNAREQGGTQICESPTNVLHFAYMNVQRCGVQCKKGKRQNLIIQGFDDSFFCYLGLPTMKTIKE